MMLWFVPMLLQVVLETAAAIGDTTPAHPATTTTIFQPAAINTNFATNSNCSLTLTPDFVHIIQVGKFQWITIACNCCAELSNTSGSSRLYLIVYSPNRKVASPSHHARIIIRRTSPKCPQDIGKDFSLCGFTTIDPDEHLLDPENLGFYVESNQVGRVTFKVDLIVVQNNITRVARNPKSLGMLLARAPVRAEVKLQVSTKRRIRGSDLAFQWTTAFIACMLALCMGCMTNLRESRIYFVKPLSLITCLVCQHLLMPVLAFGLILLMRLPHDFGIGVFITATVPGGGMAHLTVFLMKGDAPLSGAISITNSVLVLVTSPAWLYGLGWYFEADMKVHLFVLWLLPPLSVHIGGAILQYMKPSWAEAVLNWIARPVLLLSGILMITLGVYINHYAFDYIDARLMFSAMALIGIGFMLGGLAGFITQHDKPARKSLAAETSVFACLIVMPAIRYSLPPPTGDLATIFPLWGTFFTPTPIILYFCAHKVKGVMLNFIEKRKEKQYRHYSIVSSLAKMAEEVSAVSAPLVIDESDQPFDYPDHRDDKEAIVTLHNDNQKVTSL